MWQSAVMRRLITAVFLFTASPSNCPQNVRSGLRIRHQTSMSDSDVHLLIAMHTTCQRHSKLDLELPNSQRCASFIFAAVIPGAVTTGASMLHLSSCCLSLISCLRGSTSIVALLCACNTYTQLQVQFDETSTLRRSITPTAVSCMINSPGQSQLARYINACQCW